MYLQCRPECGIRMMAGIVYVYVGTTFHSRGVCSYRARIFTGSIYLNIISRGAAIIPLDVFE